jgi:hypothetical protein
MQPVAAPQEARMQKTHVVTLFTLTLVGCSTPTDLSDTSAASTGTDAAVIDTVSTFTFDGGAPPGPTTPTTPTTPTSPTSPVIETVQTITFGEPTLGVAFTDPVPTTEVRTCYSHEGSGGQFFTNCADDLPVAPPPTSWVNFSIEESLEEVKKTKNSDTRELWVVTDNNTRKWKQNKAAGTEFTHQISFGARFYGEVKEGSRPLIDSRIAGPDIRNASIQCKAASNNKKVSFDNVKTDASFGFGINLSLSFKLISVNNLLDAGAAWGAGWETSTDRNFTFAAEITGRVMEVHPGDDVVAKCESFWRAEVPVVSQLLADRVRVGWPALLTRLPQAAKCDCTSSGVIHSYNQCRGDTTQLVGTDHIIKQLVVAQYTKSGSWNTVEALEKCNTNEWKQSAIVGMRAECSQPFTLAGNGWNDWCRQNWPRSIERYYRWWYQGSLRKDCNTITPESLTCTIN